MGGSAGFKVVRELWIKAAAAAIFLKIRLAGVPVADVTWQLPNTIPTNGQILDASVTGNVVTLNWVAKPTGGGGTPTVTSLSSAAGSTQLFRGASGTAFANIEFYDLLVLNSLTSPQKTALGGNVCLIQTGIDTLDILFHDRLQAIAAEPNPASPRIPILGTNGLLSFLATNTFCSATGTPSDVFRIDNDGTPILLKATSGALALRNDADNANAALTVSDITVTGNLIVQGTTTAINTAQMNVADNIFTLNSDLPIGVAPTENAGFQINRGSSGVLDVLIWDETIDAMMIHQGGSLKRVAVVEEVSFVHTIAGTVGNLNFTGGVLTWTHNKGVQRFPVQLVRPGNKGCDVEPSYDTVNVASFDLTGFLPLEAGTWYVVG